MIKLRRKKIHGIIEFTFNKKVLGYACRDVDGFYNFWFQNTGHDGYWESHVLREIADIVDALNAEYNNNLDEYFKENPPFDNDKNIERTWSDM